VISNKITTPTVVQIFQPVQTISTIIFAYLVYNEKLILQDYVGSIFVMLGLFLVIISSYLENKENKK
jgi:drug/metabolite transporter (DMT)-like permease